MSALVKLAVTSRLAAQRGTVTPDWRIPAADVAAAAGDGILLLIYRLRLIKRAPLDSAHLCQTGLIAIRVGAFAVARRLIARGCLAAPSESRTWLALSHPRLNGGSAQTMARHLDRAAASQGGPRRLDRGDEAVAIAAAQAACRPGNGFAALAVLLRLWAIGLNIRSWLSPMAAAAIDQLDLQKITGSQRAVLVDIIARTQSIDLRFRFLKAMLVLNRSVEAFDILREAGIGRFPILASAALARQITGKAIGPTAFFHPEPVPQRGQQFYVIGAPKSASLFVATALSDMFGFPIINLSQHQVSGHDIEVEFFFNFFTTNCIVHQHAKPTPMTRALFSEFDIAPLVTVRNVFDTMISLRDQRLTKGYAIDKHFAGLSEADQTTVIFTETFKSLLDFYVTWVRAIRDGRIRGILVDYRYLIENAADVTTRLLSENGAAMDPAVVAGATERASTAPMKANINRARGKRLPFDIGYDIVPPHIVALARSAYRNYPDVDFRMFDHRYDAARH